MPFASLYFFSHTPPPAIYALSLHDALPISHAREVRLEPLVPVLAREGRRRRPAADEVAQLLQVEGRVRDRHEPAARTQQDRKSTRLNSSHLGISYAVFCLKKKKNKRQ